MVLAKKLLPSFGGRWRWSIYTDADDGRMGGRPVDALSKSPLGGGVVSETGIGTSNVVNGEDKLGHFKVNERDEDSFASITSGKMKGRTREITEDNVSIIIAIVMNKVVDKSGRKSKRATEPSLFQSTKRLPKKRDFIQRTEETKMIKKQAEADKQADMKGPRGRLEPTLLGSVREGENVMKRGEINTVIGEDSGEKSDAVAFLKAGGKGKGMDGGPGFSIIVNDRNPHECGV